MVPLIFNCGPVRTTFHNLATRKLAGARPEYCVTFTGPEHARLYTAVVKSKIFLAFCIFQPLKPANSVNGVEYGRGDGRSADEAKDNAATLGLQTLRR